MTAAHAIRAVLECHGIEARTEGFAILLALSSVRAVRAGSDVVPEAMRARAESVLERLLPGGDPPRIDAATLANHVSRSAPRSSGRSRSVRWPLRSSWRSRNRSWSTRPSSLY